MAVTWKVCDRKVSAGRVRPVPTAKNSNYEQPLDLSLLITQLHHRGFLGFATIASTCSKFPSLESQMTEDRIPRATEQRVEYRRSPSVILS